MAKLNSALLQHFTAKAAISLRVQPNVRYLLSEYATASFSRTLSTGYTHQAVLHAWARWHSAEKSSPVLCSLIAAELCEPDRMERAKNKGGGRAGIEYALREDKTS